MTVTPVHRVLVGWDGSPAAHAALTTAMSIADGDGVVIARAVLTPARHTETGGEQARDLDAQRRWLREQFDAALAVAATHGSRVCFEWGESDDAADDLCACAEHHGCDLVVMGRHGDHTHVRTLRLGPVAEATIRHTSVPVLLVSPVEAQQPAHA
jgi:nucleotide-binding universal stress UspA family protein